MLNKATAEQDSRRVRRQGTVVQVRRTKWHLTKQQSSRPRNRSRVEPQLIDRHKATTATEAGGRVVDSSWRWVPDGVA